MDSVTLTPHEALSRLNETAELKGLIAQAHTLAMDLDYRGLAYRLREMVKEVERLGTAQLAHGRSGS